MRMGRAFPLLMALVSSAGAVAAIGAGSSSTDNPLDPPDGSKDGDTTDGKTEGGPVTDGGKKEGGNCTPVKGDCDLVLQDCPAKEECVITGSGKNYKTTCRGVSPAQHLGTGASCCPGQDNECLPGLTCIGEPCVDSGTGSGPVTARCSPTCCSGDDPACGKSDPEGIAGQCDLIITAPGDIELHNACSYKERCKPFKIEPCKAGQICIVEDKVGSASCINSNGKGNREACKFANDCQDGFICAGGGDAGRCRMFCLVPNSVTPFDASAADGAPGQGGCPSGETCTGPKFTNLPDWLRLCALPDGG